MVLKSIPAVTLAAALAALLMASGLSVPSVASAKEDEKREADDDSGAAIEPDLSLKVSTHHGFRPLTIMLTGQLSGVETDDALYCHAGLEWEVRSPWGVVSSSKQDPRCLHPPELIDVQMTFTKFITISRPGTYTYRLILHRRDGDVLFSNTQEVRVLSNY